MVWTFGSINSMDRFELGWWLHSSLGNQQLQVNPNWLSLCFHRRVFDRLTTWEKGVNHHRLSFFFPQLHFTLKYSSWLITITRFNNFFNSNARVYYIETMNYFVDMSKQCKRTYSFARASGSTISIVDFSNLQFSQLLRLFTLCQL
jgi:hypothetical protein